MPDPTPTDPARPIEPISADAARARLEAAIAARCGPGWQAEDSGWLLVTGHDYMARLTRGTTNLDFYVDLLGEVTIEEREANDAQTSGRLLVWVFALLALGIGYSAARAFGWL